MKNIGKKNFNEFFIPFYNEFSLFTVIYLIKLASLWRVIMRAGENCTFTAYEHDSVNARACEISNIIKSCLNRLKMDVLREIQSFLYFLFKSSSLSCQQLWYERI